MTRLLSIVALIATVSLAHPWACFHADPGHSGLSPYVVGDTLAGLWSFPAGGQVSGSPVIRDDGAVLFGARDVKLYCLLPSGAQDWAADLSGYGSSIYYSAPALDDSGNAYITTSRKLVKVGRDGSVLWAWPAGSGLSISHSPVIGGDGKIYFACYSESLYALNPDSTVAWTRDLGAAVNSAPAVTPDGRVCVATTRDSINHSLWSWSFDGDSSWRFPLAGDAEFASPAVGPDSTIYVGAGRYVYAVRPGGVLKWRDSLSAQVWTCPAIANESTLYVVAGARLYCIDTDSGALRWRISIGGSNYCSPAVDAEGRVYVGSANSTSSMLYCIAPDSTILWSHGMPGDVWSSPAIGPNARVYVGCMNNSLFAFGGSSTAIDADPAPTPAAARIRPNPAHGTAVVCGLESGPVRLVDAAGRVHSPVAGAGGRLELRGLAPGVYLVLLHDSDVKLVIR